MLIGIWVDTFKVSGWMLRRCEVWSFEGVGFTSLKVWRWVLRRVWVYTLGGVRLEA